MPNVSSPRAELKEWQRYLRITELTQSSSSSNLPECLELTDENIFPNIRTLLIGCTLPIGSCEAERSFPSCDGSKPTIATEWGRWAFWAHPDEHEPRHGDSSGNSLSNVHRKEQTENILKLQTVSIINVTQIRCTNIITMEKATSTGA